MKRKATREKYKLMFFPNLFTLKSPAILLDNWIREQETRKKEYLAKLEKLRRGPHTLESDSVFIPIEMLDYAVYLEEKKVTSSFNGIRTYYNTPQSKPELMAKILWAIKYDSYQDRLDYFNAKKQNGINHSVYSFFHLDKHVSKRHSFFRIEHGKILEDYVEKDGYLYTRFYEINSIKWKYEPSFGFDIKLTSTVVAVK